MSLLSLFAFACLVASSSAATIRLNKLLHDSGPRSLWGSRHGAAPLQAHIPTEGSIWPTAIFWTTVQVGTPPQSFAVAIDSGSPNIYLSGKGCNGCVTNFPNVPYVPSDSSTSKKLTGSFNATYYTCDPTQPLKSCTISGPFYSDVASLAGFGPAAIDLGIIENQTKDFYQFQTIDGILGMVTNQMPDKGNVFQALCIRGSFCEPVWGICMTEGLLSNGTMTVGSVDDRLSDGPIQYVPSPNRTAWHEVQVFNLSFGSSDPAASYPLPANTWAILDTGTNNLILPTYLYLQAQKSICSDPALAHCEEFFSASSPCFALSQSEVDAYPPLVFTLDNGVQLTMTSRDYLLKGSPTAASPELYCLGISNGAASGYFIFGDTMMQNYYLVFKEQQVGWGKVNRRMCGSI